MVRRVIYVGSGILVTLLLLVALSSEGRAGPPPGKIVELNSASLTDLMVLPGIGRARARAIVEYRRRRPFQRTSDLMRIEGIGRKTYFKLKPYVRVAPNKKEGG